jgi:hypothetical protein
MPDIVMANSSTNWDAYQVRVHEPNGIYNSEYLNQYAYITGLPKGGLISGIRVHFVQYKGFWYIEISSGILLKDNVIIKFDTSFLLTTTVPIIPKGSYFLASDYPKYYFLCLEYVKLASDRSQPAKLVVLPENKIDEIKHMKIYSLIWTDPWNCYIELACDSMQPDGDKLKITHPETGTMISMKDFVEYLLRIGRLGGYDLEAGIGIDIGKNKESKTMIVSVDFDNVLLEAGESTEDYNEAELPEGGEGPPCDGNGGNGSGGPGIEAGPGIIFTTDTLTGKTIISIDPAYLGTLNHEMLGNRLGVGSDNKAWHLSTSERDILFPPVTGITLNVEDATLSFNERPVTGITLNVEDATLSLPPTPPTNVPIISMTIEPSVKTLILLDINEEDIVTSVDVIPSSNTIIVPSHNTHVYALEVTPSNYTLGFND